MTTDFENAFDNDPNFLKPEEPFWKQTIHPKSAVAEFINGRPLLKLYKVLLEEYMFFSCLNKYTGLCVVIKHLYRYHKVSVNEHDKLMSDFIKRKPEGKNTYDFWFKNKEERIQFLESIIKELENEK